MIRAAARAVAIGATMATAAAAQTTGDGGTGLPIFDPEIDQSLGLENMADPASDPLGGGLGSGEEIITFTTPETAAATDTISTNARADLVVESAGAAVLRGLDKISGETVDLELAVGETAAIGRIAVTLSECRYPADNPAGDAFAYVTVDAQEREEPQFQGWMIASAPALNALDHPRYDVWVIRCRTSR